MTTTAQGWAPLKDDPLGSDTHNRYGDAYADMHADMVTTLEDGSSEVLLSVGRPAAVQDISSISEAGVTLWMRDAEAGAYRVVDAERTFPTSSPANKHSWTAMPGKVAVARSLGASTPYHLNLRIYTVVNNLLDGPVALDWDPQPLYTASGGVGLAQLRDTSVSLSFTPSGDHLWAMVSGTPMSYGNAGGQSFLAALKVAMDGTVVFEHMIFVEDVGLDPTLPAHSYRWKVGAPINALENEVVGSVFCGHYAYASYLSWRGAVRFSELNPAFDYHTFLLDDSGNNYPRDSWNTGLSNRSGNKFLFRGAQYGWSPSAYDYQGRLWIDRDFNEGKVWEGAHAGSPSLKMWDNVYPLAGQPGYIYVNSKRGIGVHQFEYYNSGLTHLSNEPVSVKEFTFAEVPEFRYSPDWFDSNPGEIKTPGIFVDDGDAFVSMGPVSVDSLAHLEDMPESYEDSAPTLALVAVGVSPGSSAGPLPPSEIPEGNWIFTYEPVRDGRPATTKFEELTIYGTPTQTLSGREWIYDNTASSLIQAITRIYTEVGDGSLPAEASSWIKYRAIRNNPPNEYEAVQYAGAIITGTATHVGYLIIAEDELYSTQDGATFNFLASLDTTSHQVEYVMNIAADGTVSVLADGAPIGEFPGIPMSAYEFAFIAPQGSSGAIEGIAFSQDIYVPAAGGGTGSGLTYGVAEVELGGSADIVVDSFSHHTMIMGESQARLLDQAGRGKPV